MSKGPRHDQAVVADPCQAWHSDGQSTWAGAGSRTQGTTPPGQAAGQSRGQLGALVQGLAGLQQQHDPVRGGCAGVAAVAEGGAQAATVPDTLPWASVTMWVAHLAASTRQSQLQGMVGL